MTRNGKIARLPRNIRHTLNARLDNGELGRPLIQWLNTLPEVQAILAADFEGRPINDQNLCEWKQGGYRDWQRRQEACNRVRALIELSDGLDDAADQNPIPERLASILAVELATETSRLLDATTDPTDRWRYLCEALRQINSLRKGDLAASRAQIDSERWEIECERREQEEAVQEERRLRNQATAPIWDALKRRTLLSLFGGGEDAEKIADFFEQVARTLDDPPHSTEASDSPPPAQTEFKPVQTNSN
jgi:hypothetical protein